MYVSFPPGRGSTLPPPSSPSDPTPAAAAPAAGTASLAAHHAGELEAVALDIDELSRAVFHLTRSNTELRAALVDTPGDPDFEAAIVENVDVIAAKLSKLAELKKVYNAMLASAGGAAVASVGVGAAAAAASSAAPESKMAGVTAPGVTAPVETGTNGLDADGGLLL